VLDHRDSLLKITLAETPDATRLTLLHELLDVIRADMPEVAEQVGFDWESALTTSSQRSKGAAN
jgi:hypothetical protein